MKTFFACLALLLVTTAFRKAPVLYQANPAASQLTWTGHAEVGSWAPSGTMKLQAGRFEYGGSTLRNGRFEFDMRSIAHEQAQLAEHLKAADFFNVAKHPTAVFLLREAANGKARGELTIKGVTKPIEFPATVERRPDGNLRVRGTATIDRTEFGVKYNSTSFFKDLGDQAIRNDFQLAFDVLALPAKAQ